MVCNAGQPVCMAGRRAQQMADMGITCSYYIAGLPLLQDCCPWASPLPESRHLNGFCCQCSLPHLNTACHRAELIYSSIRVLLSCYMVACAHIHVLPTWWKSQQTVISDSTLEAHGWAHAEGTGGAPWHGHGRLCAASSVVRVVAGATPVRCCSIRGCSAYW